MSAFSNPRIEWANIVSNYRGFPSFKSLSGNVRITIGNVTSTGSQLVLEDPDELEVRDAVELAESFGLDVVTTKRFNGTVVEVLA